MCLVPYTVNGHFCFSWSINKSHYIDSKIFLQCKFDFVTEVDGSLGSIYDFHCLRLYNIIWNHIRSIFLLTSSITILCRNFPFMPWKQDSKNLESSVFLIHFIFLFIWIITLFILPIISVGWILLVWWLPIFLLILFASIGFSLSNSFNHHQIFFRCT